jgi:hypothetical protein
MVRIATDYYRTRAASELGARGYYPKQGILHGPMYAMTFIVGLAIGSTMGGLPSWVAMVLGLAGLVVGWCCGASVDRRYDAVVGERAVEMQQAAAEARQPGAQD